MTRLHRSSPAPALAALALIAPAAVWLAMSAFPLQAQTPAAAVGSPLEAVVEDSGEVLLYRPAAKYPPSALLRGVEGRVRLDVAIDEEGLVTDARVVEGPQELRKPALQAVLEWRFANESGARRLPVTLRFDLPDPATVTSASPTTHVLNTTRLLHQHNLPEASRTLRRIVALERIEGLPDGRLDAFLGRVFEPNDRGLPGELHETIFSAAPGATPRVVFQPEGATLVIEPPAVASSTFPKTIHVDGPVQSRRALRKVQPTYPSEAKQDGVDGIVLLKAMIDPQGVVAGVDVERGHPLLIPAAVEAVRQWRYQPTLLNGQPVAVETDVEISFTLSR